MEQLKKEIQILEYKMFMINDKEKKAELETELEVLKVKLKELETADDIEEDTNEEDYTDYDYDIEEDTDNGSIDWDNDIMLPTHKDIRNNSIEECGRGRKRNTNDVYKNIVISLTIGKVGNNKMNAEYNKIVYEKDIDKALEELKAQGVKKVPSKSRLTKDLKQINKQLGIKYVNIINTTDNGLCYQISQSYDNKYFVIVPLYKVKELLEFKENLFRLFICISMHKDISMVNSVLMTRSYLCKCMDIEPNEANKNYIGNMVRMLFKLGLIDVEKEIRTEYINGVTKVKTYHFYRLTTHEEFKEKGRYKERKK